MIVKRSLTSISSFKIVVAFRHSSSSVSELSLFTSFLMTEILRFLIIVESSSVKLPSSIFIMESKTSLIDFW